MQLENDFKIVINGQITHAFLLSILILVLISAKWRFNAAYKNPNLI